MRIRAVSVLAVTCVLTLGACSTTISSGSAIEKGPVGTGAGVNETKGSPCACVEINQSIPGLYLEEAV